MRANLDSRLKETLAAISLSRLPGVGASTFKKLINRFFSPSAAMDFYLKDLAKKTRDNPENSPKKAPTEKGIEAARQFCRSEGKAVFFGHPDYPRLLAELREPPPVLFMKGNLPDKPGVAIVGSRLPDERGKAAARNLAARLAREKIAIVSGGAKGIDTIAHHAALQSNSTTIAVLGTGIDVVYPKENFRLFEEIAQKGALLSELLPGTPPRRDFFPTRNRIVAGLVKAVLVIQAAENSGALITARYARKFGRKVFVLKPSSETPGWLGNRNLLSLGAIPIDENNDLKELLFCAS